jgi:hypothetical protein
MTNDAKRTSQLGISTTLQSNDRVVVLTNPASSAQTQTIAVNNFASAIVNILPIANTTAVGVISAGPGISIAANGQLTAPMPLATNTAVGVVRTGNNISVDANGTISINLTGPYANDSVAATNSIPLRGLYYNSNGTVQIRLV